MRPLLPGLVLAATIAEDKHGEAAREGLAPELAHALSLELAELRALDPSGRERALARLATRVRPPITAAEGPPRALSILAPDARRELGTRWMADAPMPRRGFRPTAPLRAALRVACAPHTPDEHTLPLGLAVLRAGLAQEPSLATYVEPSMAAAASSAQQPDDAASAVRFLRIALHVARGWELVRLLGGMELGARSPRDAQGAAQRAGAEIATLEAP